MVPIGVLAVTLLLLAAAGWHLSVQWRALHAYVAAENRDMRKALKARNPVPADNVRALPRAVRTRATADARPAPARKVARKAG